MGRLVQNPNVRVKPVCFSLLCILKWKISGLYIVNVYFICTSAYYYCLSPLLHNMVTKCGHDILFYYIINTLSST